MLLVDIKPFNTLAMASLSGSSNEAHVSGFPSPLACWVFGILGFNWFKFESQ